MNELSMALPHGIWLKKLVETHWLTRYENVLSRAISEECDVDSGMKKYIIIAFL